MNILIILIVFCILVWFPILFYLISQRSLAVLLVWLLIAPIVTNLIQQPGANPFFSVPQIEEEYLESKGPVSLAKHDSFLRSSTVVRMNELLDPTRMLFGFFLVVFLFNFILKKRYLAPFDRTEFWMVIFSLLLIINVLFLSQRTFRGLRVAADTCIIPFAAYYITRRVVTSEDRFRQFIRTLGFLGMYLIISALLERSLHQGLVYRVSGPFPDRNYLFVVLSTVFFMVLTEALGSQGFVEKRPALSRGVRSFLIIFAPVVVLLTLTRGNIIGFLMAMGVFTLLGRRMTMVKRKLGILGVALILTPVFVYSVTSLVPQALVEKRFADDTIGMRLRAFEVAISEGFTHPFFGIGLENMQFVYAAKREHGWFLPTAHNVYLTMFAEFGVPGLVAYLGIIVAVLRQGWHLYQAGLHSRDHWWGWQGVGIIALMSAYIIPPLTSNLQLRPSLCHVYVFASLGAVTGLYSYHGTRRILSLQRHAPTRYSNLRG